MRGGVCMFFFCMMVSEVGSARVVFGGFDGGPVALMGLGERGSLQIFFLQFAIVFNSHCGLLFYFFCNFFMFFLISAFKNVR